MFDLNTQNESLPWKIPPHCKGTKWWYNHDYLTSAGTWNSSISGGGGLGLTGNKTSVLSVQPGRIRGICSPENILSLCNSIFCILRILCRRIQLSWTVCFTALQNTLARKHFFSRCDKILIFVDTVLGFTTGGGGGGGGAAPPPPDCWVD